MCLNNLNDLELNSKFLILDCDTFYKENILSLYNNSENGNTIFYFIDKEDKPIFSYLEIGDDNRVLSIQEKNKISENASTGAYGFSDGHTLKKYCEQVSEQSGELYISNIYKKIIDDGILVSSIEIDNFNCVGTPIQLKIF
jgi:dTDP-glucose pyrophosphorylase